MNRSEKEQAIEDLYKELSTVMGKYAESVKRDDFFEIKRRLISRIREIEKEIQYLNLELKEEFTKQHFQ